MTKNNIVIICLFVFAFSLNLNGQQDTLNTQTDTSQNNVADKALSLMIKADSVSLADSISKAVLIKQLDELRSYERSKRRQIENELEQIRLKDSIRMANLAVEIERLKENAIGYPVVAHKDTLFIIYTKIGSLTPAERADIVTERLEVLYRQFFLKSDSLVIVDNGQAVDIYFKDKIILSVAERDELWLERPKIEIANEYKSLILMDIADFKADRSFWKIFREAGLTILVITLQILLILLINYIFRAKINKLLWNKRGIWFKGIHFRKHEIINDDQETTAIIFLTKIIRYGINIFQLYLTIPILFLIFPPTQRLAETLFGYISSPLKKIGYAFISYIPELITILVVVVITRYILKFLKFLAKEIENETISIPGFYPDWGKPTYSIIKILILAFMFIVIFPYLPGSDSAVFKGVSVFIGIVFSLGSTSIVGNMIAGLVITYMRPFKKGDRIKIGDVVGNIVEKSPFATRIRTPKKEFITIPNSNILASNVINYSNSKIQGGLIVHTTVTIGYDIPWRKVHQILMNAAKETANLNMDIAPFVLQTSLDDFYVSYQLNAHTNEPDKQPAIYSELHQNIQDGFNEAGIEILSPHYRAARDGNTMAIPKDYHPENYNPSGFRIKKNEE